MPLSDKRSAPIAILLIGGLLLVVLGQVVYGDVYPQLRWLAVLLILIGLVSFGLAAYLMAGRRLPSWLIIQISRFCRYFTLTKGQLILLFLAPCFALLASLAAGDELKAINFPLSLLSWIMAVSFAIGGSYRFAGDATNEKDVNQFDNKDLIAIAILFVLALLLRVIALGSIPTTLSGDEGSAGLMAVKYLSGEANNILTLGWFSFPTLYFAFQSLGIAILGQTVAGLRLFSAIGGALTVAAVYILARTLFDRRTALLSAIFLSVFHYHIHFSRIGLNNIWDGFFAVVIMAGFWHGWKTGRRSSFLIAGLALGLGQYFYVSIRIFPALLLLWLGLAFFFDRQRFKRRVPDLILAAFVTLVVVLPLIFTFVRHPAEFNAPYQRVTIFDGWLAEKVVTENKPAFMIILDQMVASSLGFTHLPLRHWYNPGSPLLRAAAAGLFLLGILWLIVRPKLSHILILLPVAAVIVTGGLSLDAPASQRYVLAAPFVAILVAVPLAETTQWLVTTWPRQRLIVTAFLVIFMTWLVITDLRYYFFEVYDHYVLGGINTQVATEVANYLDEQDQTPDVFFFGFPRMGYGSLSTIAYLVPEVQAEDVLEPLSTTPSWRLTQPTIFIFLPERMAELDYVRTAYPDGNYREMKQQNGDLLFLSYEVPAR